MLLLFTLLKKIKETTNLIDAINGTHNLRCYISVNFNFVFPRVAMINFYRVVAIATGDIVVELSTFLSTFLWLFS